MIISGTLLSVAEALPSPDLTTRLEVGKILTGRVTQMGPDGQGVLRFPDGRGFTFSHGPSLKIGEPVQLQVVRLTPDIAFRLLLSPSGIAAGLAESAEQSLVRAPDIFANLLRWSGLGAGHAAAAGTEENNEARLFALNSGSHTSTLMTSKGLTLAQVLQKILPNLSAQGLMRGEMKALVNLLENGSRQDVRGLIGQLRQVALDLFRVSDPSGQARLLPQEESAELSAVRSTLHRLGDLLAMQEILPRTALSLEGGQLLGYRLFWLTEGGMGEAIWQRERARKKNKEDEPSVVTTVLLSLNMTSLGAVQARLSYGEGLCSVAIAAEEEESLSALRGQIGDLRHALLEAELPLRSLDLSRLRPGEMKEKRMESLGLASHFSTEA